MSAGIDYGRGVTNVDHETGIRYGVISQHAVSQAWCDSAEADYGAASCPKCGADALEYDSEKHGEYDDSPGCADHACESCQYVFDSQDAFSEEAIGWNYSGDGYEATDCLDSDIMILKSPFYTKAVFCSPCVPGACSIESPDDDGAKAYCFGVDWFEDEKPCYPIWRVEDDSLVYQPAEEKAA